MVIAYHAILSAYGFWLPNDPRGSWSDFVGSWDLFRFGAATTVNTRCSVAGARHDAKHRLSAKEALKFSPVVWTPTQVNAIGRGFECASTEGGYQIHACAILAEHVHVVIARHERKVERIVGHLKTRGTQELLETESWQRGQPVWSKSMWKVFIDSAGHLGKAIAYVENNPLKEGRESQHWSFVVPYTV